MIESDFYKLTIDTEVWYKGEKKQLDTIRTWGGKHPYISFVNVNENFEFKDIMHDLSFEKPFEVKKDCMHREPEGEPFCMKKEGFISACKSDLNCHNCSDYEKKKKLVRYYEHYVYDPRLNKERVAYLDTTRNNKPYMPISKNGSTVYIAKKVCPETNRIMIEIEE